MKLFYLLPFLFSTNALAQKDISGKVLNTITSKPVPYASVAIMQTNIATNADSSGQFEFDRPIRFPDTLLITSVGFFDEKVPLTDYRKHLVKLRPNPLSLDSLVLMNYRTNETLNDFSSCSNTVYTTNGTMTHMAQFFSAPKPFCKIGSIELCKTTGYDHFRIRIYSVDSAGRLKPGVDVTDQVLEVKSRKRKLKIDLSDHDIVIPGLDFFVAIEWLFTPENAHKTKYHSQDGRKVKALEYGPYLGVRMHRAGAYVVSRDFKGRWITHRDLKLLLAVDLMVP